MAPHAPTRPRRAAYAEQEGFAPRPPTCDPWRGRRAGSTPTSRAAGAAGRHTGLLESPSVEEVPDGATEAFPRVYGSAVSSSPRPWSRSARSSPVRQPDRRDDRGHDDHAGRRHLRAGLPWCSTPSRTCSRRTTRCGASRTPPTTWSPAAASYRDEHADPLQRLPPGEVPDRFDHTDPISASTSTTCHAAAPPGSLTARRRRTSGVPLHVAGRAGPDGPIAAPAAAGALGRLDRSPFTSARARPRLGVGERRTQRGWSACGSSTSRP